MSDIEEINCPATNRKAVNGGCPVRRQGHNPVDGREAHHKNVKNDARASQHFEAKAQGAVGLVDVLPASTND